MEVHRAPVVWIFHERPPGGGERGSRGGHHPIQRQKGGVRQTHGLAGPATHKLPCAMSCQQLHAVQCVERA